MRLTKIKVMRITSADRQYVAPGDLRALLQGSLGPSYADQFCDVADLRFISERSVRPQVISVLILFGYYLSFGWSIVRQGPPAIGRSCVMMRAIRRAR